MTPKAHHRLGQMYGRLARPFFWLLNVSYRIHHRLCAASVRQFDRECEVRARRRLKP
jgi:hypothetical protein